jgi:hypothetical protein
MADIIYTNPACNAFTAILANNCKTDSGGILNVWITPFQGTGAQFSFEVASGSGNTVDQFTTITGLVSSGSLVGTGSLYQVTPARTEGSAHESFPIDTTNTIFKQQVILMYPKNQATLRNFVMSLAQSNTVAFVEDRMHQFWLYGSDNGLQASGDFVTGKMPGDKNAWTITLEGDETYNALPVSAALMTQLIAYPV